MSEMKIISKLNYISGPELNIQYSHHQFDHFV